MVVHLDGCRGGTYDPAPRVAGETGETMTASTIHNDWNPLPHLDDRPSYDSVRFTRDARGRRLWLRERRYVDRFLSTLRPGSIVLDVPSGMGRFTELIDHHGHRAVSVDLLFEHVHYIANREDVVSSGALQADIGRLPFDDDSVDAAICIRLLHHLTPSQIGTALGELRRVARSALFTYYSRRTLKFLKKQIRRRPLRGRYYTPATMERFCLDAGWSESRALTSSPLHNLHFVVVDRAASSTIQAA